MNKITILICLSLLLLGCIGKPPSDSELKGVWRSSDGAILKLKGDQTFIGKSLPAEHFTNYSMHNKNKDAVVGQKVSGSGKWNLIEGQGRWEIKLCFEQSSSKEMFGADQVFLSRTGLFGTGDTWYLFLWIGDDVGSARYVFEKK